MTNFGVVALGLFFAVPWAIGLGMILMHIRIVFVP